MRTSSARRMQQYILTYKVIDMKTKITYFAKYPDGTAVWYAPDAEIKPGYIEKTERQVLVADDGKELFNIKTRESVVQVWVKDGESVDWVEIEKLQEQLINQAQFATGGQQDI